MVSGERPESGQGVTFRETAAAMRRLADGIESVCAKHGDCETGEPEPLLDGEAACGAAALLRYIRDLVTTGEREVYDRATLLVVLECISRDDEIFPCGLARLIWQAEDEDDPAV